MPYNAETSDKEAASVNALARHTAIYGVGSILTAASGLVLIPLYTNAFETNVYGLLEILNQLANLAILVIFLGTNHAFVRFFFDDANIKSKKQLTATSLTFSIASSLVIVLLASACFLLIPSIGQNSGIPTSLFLVVIAWIPFEALFVLFNQFLVATRRPVIYVAINTGKFLLFVALNVIFLHMLAMDLMGVFLSSLIVSGAIACGFLTYIGRWCGFRLDSALLKKMLSFGLPYLPTAGFMYVISTADRFALGAFVSMETVGLYALGAKIGTIGMVLLMRPIDLVWSPFIYSACTASDGSKRIGNALTVYSALLVYVGLGVALSGSLIIRWFSDPDYYRATIIVPLMALSGAFYGMACLIDAGIKIAKRTIYKPFILGAAAAVSVCLHLTITPRFGLVGAAISTTATIFVWFIINYRVSERCYSLELHLQDFVAMFGSAIALYAAMSGFINNADNFWLQAAVLLCAALAYPLLFVSFSRFTFSDVSDLVLNSLSRAR